MMIFAKMAATAAATVVLSVGVGGAAQAGEPALSSPDTSTSGSTLGGPPQDGITVGPLHLSCALCWPIVL